MTEETSICEVWSTVPDVKVARRLMHGILEQKLAACVNILTGLESAYWWEGKIEHAHECLMICKTTEAKAKELQAWIIAHHPYECPSAVTLPIMAGHKNYLQWVKKIVEKV